MATTTLGTPGHRSRSMNTIYWIVGIVIVLAIVSYFAMRSPMTTPTDTQGTVNTDARSGEIGSSGAASESSDTTVPARTNDTDQR